MLALGFFELSTIFFQIFLKKQKITNGQFDNIFLTIFYQFFESNQQNDIFVNSHLFMESQLLRNNFFMSQADDRIDSLNYNAELIKR